MEELTNEPNRLSAQGGVTPSFIGLFLNGRYRVDAPLGKGGFASVFRGLDTNTGQQVAIKILTQRDGRYDDEDKARFENEVYITAKLRSPYVVKVLERGTEVVGDSEHMWYVASLIDGQTLHEFCKSRAHHGYPRGVMNPLEVLKLLERVAIVLDDGHTLSTPVIHRDLKPQNIMITGATHDRMQVYVLDYGIAKLVGGDSEDSFFNAFETQADRMVGTPAYMAPEFLTGGDGTPPTPAIDLYALGMIAFVCLTGSLPFKSLVPSDIFLGQLTERFELPERLADSWIAPIIYKLLEKDLDRSQPKRRYQSAEELLRDLNNLSRSGAYEEDLGVSNAVVGNEREPGRVEESTGMLEAAGLGVVKRITGINTAVVNPDVATVKLDSDKAWKQSYGDRRTVPQVDSDEINRRIAALESAPASPVASPVVLPEPDSKPLDASASQRSVSSDPVLVSVPASVDEKSEPTKSSNRVLAVLGVLVVTTLIAGVGVVVFSDGGTPPAMPLASSSRAVPVASPKATEEKTPVELEVEADPLSEATEHIDIPEANTGNEEDTTTPDGVQSGRAKPLATEEVVAPVVQKKEAPKDRVERPSTRSKSKKTKKATSAQTAPEPVDVAPVQKKVTEVTTPVKEPAEVKDEPDTTEAVVPKKKKKRRPGFKGLN